MYSTCKCGTKLNMEVVEKCPVCEDAENKDHMRLYRSERLKKRVERLLIKHPLARKVN